MELPYDPDNLNSDRAEWAGDAIAAFMQATGTEPEKALPDLLCDLMHWADRHHEAGFESALELARWEYDQETTHPWSPKASSPDRPKHPDDKPVTFKKIAEHCGMEVMELRLRKISDPADLIGLPQPE